MESWLEGTARTRLGKAKVSGNSKQLGVTVCERTNAEGSGKSRIRRQY